MRDLAGSGSDEALLERWRKSRLLERWWEYGDGVGGGVGSEDAGCSRGRLLEGEVLGSSRVRLEGFMFLE